MSCPTCETVVTVYLPLKQSWLPCRVGWCHAAKILSAIHFGIPSTQNPLQSGHKVYERFEIEIKNVLSASKQIDDKANEDDGLIKFTAKLSWAVTLLSQRCWQIGHSGAYLINQCTPVGNTITTFIMPTFILWFCTTLVWPWM